MRQTRRDEGGKLQEYVFDLPNPPKSTLRQNRPCRFRHTVTVKAIGRIGRMIMQRE
jgi:hypothetical protein